MPLMKMGNLGRGTFDLDKVEFVQEGVTVDQTHRLRKGDVLFNTRNTLDLVGKVAIWRDELPVAYYNSNLMRLEFDPRHVHSNRYANYLLNSAAYISLLRALATGTTSVAAIYTRDLLQLPFVCPPGSEQRAIAEALSDVDDLLTALDRLIVKKCDIKQAAMQQLLTGRKRLTGDHGEWRRVRLGEVAAMHSGGTPRSDIKGYYDGDIPWVSISDMTSVGKYITSTERMLTQAGIANSAARIFPAATVLFAMYASVGECCIAASPVSTSQAILGIRASAGLSSEFLYYWLIGSKSQLRALAQQGTQSNLSKGIVQNLELQLPSLGEQVAIAAVLSEMDAELVKLEARRDKTRQLKLGMMQALLTGRIRLVPGLADVAPCPPA